MSTFDPMTPIFILQHTNGLVTWGFTTAEKSLFTALDLTKPTVAMFEQPILIVDSLLCKSLDTLEQRVPVINYSPEVVRHHMFVEVESLISNFNSRYMSCEENGQERCFVPAMVGSTDYQEFLSKDRYPPSLHPNLRDSGKKKEREEEAKLIII